MDDLSGSQKDIYDKLIEASLNNSEIKVFTIRFITPSNSKHNTDAYNDDGKLYQYDTAGYGTGTPLSKDVNYKTIQSWYYIRQAVENDRYRIRYGR